MKTATDKLRALLESDQFSMADLFTFRLIDGTVLRYTTADGDIVSGGCTFSCGLRINRSRAAWEIGLDVDSMTLDAYPGRSDMVGDVTFLSAIREGVFDAADVEVERAFMARYGDVSAGTVTIFSGRMGEIDASRIPVQLSVNCHLELLDVKMPRNVYQSGCANTLYDTACGLVKTDFSAAGAVVAGSTTRSVLLTGTGKGDHYFDMGVIVFTSGVNNGASRTVKSWLFGAASLFPPLPVAPEPGSTAILYAGCDKLVATCRDRFGNLSRFRGFPYIPVAESAI